MKKQTLPFFDFNKAGARGENYNTFSFLGDDGSAGCAEYSYIADLRVNSDAGVTSLQDEQFNPNNPNNSNRGMSMGADPRLSALEQQRNMEVPPPMRRL